MTNDDVRKEGEFTRSSGGGDEGVDGGWRERAEWRMTELEETFGQGGAGSMLVHRRHRIRTTGSATHIKPPYHDVDDDVFLFSSCQGLLEFLCRNACKVGIKP